MSPANSDDAIPVFWLKAGDAMALVLVSPTLVKKLVITPWLSADTNRTVKSAYSKTTLATVNSLFFILPSLLEEILFGSL